ncbi:MAG: HAD-IA family hydrolase [Candidatus Magasanikbacteria bacterium]
MKKKFKAIGFDWSGVVFFHPTKYHQMVSEFLGISIENFSNSYYKHNYLINLTDIDPKEFWTIVFSDLGYESKVDAFLKVLNKLPQGKYNTDILPLLNLLKTKGYKTGLFSNHTVAGAKEARKFGVDNLFEVTLFSAEIGVMKSYPESYLLLAEKLDVDISEMIYIDDTPNNLDKAKEIGFEPILYTDMKNLLQRLKELDILTKSEIKKL